MKPLRLVTTALGPYAGEQVLDFRDLGDRTLFLIHGPTGSGKTTILDAICFALYGECSGDEREIKRIRSDHADPSAPTEVTLDFRLGTETYRIYRRPEQQRPKMRGEGTTTRRAMATLYKRTGIHDDSVEGDIIASQWSKVTEEVERLLGFHSNQFRQVVMLPQGQFRKLLLADSKERQAILEVLFQTELYRRIEEALKLTARDLESQLRDKRQHLQYILAQSETDSLDKLNGQRIGMSTRRADIQQGIEIIKAQEKAAQESLNEGRRVAEKFEEFSRAQKSLEFLEDRTETILKRRTVLERARRALPIATEEKALKRRSDEAKEAGQKLEAARISVKAARVAKEKAAQVADREVGRQLERDEARNELRRLEDLTERVQQLDYATKKLRQAHDRSIEMADELVAAVKRLEECRQRFDQNTADREKLEAVAARIGELRLQVKDAEKSARLHERLLKLGEHETTVAQQLRDTRERLENAIRTLEKESADLASLEKEWFEGQAAILAHQLKPGYPCPVCGSRDHPIPAHSDLALTSEQSVAYQRTKVEEIRQILDGIRTERASLENRISEIQASSSTLRESLGDLADKDRADLDAEWKRLLKELATAEQAAKKLETIAKETDRLQKEGADAQEIRDSAEAAKAETLADLKSAEAELRTRKEGIPDEFVDLTTLKRAQQEARAKVKKLDNALEQSRENLAQAGEQLAACKAAVAAAEDSAAQANQKVLIRRQEFERCLREAGFVDAPDYESAKRTSTEITAMQKEIDDFDHSLTSARDRVARAREATEGLSAPDLKKLESETQGIKRQLEKALREEAALVARIKWMEGLLEDYARSSAEMAVLENKYSVYGRIAEVANGNNPQGITFQRFVLAALLDDVLLAASRRLQIMSNRRYTLQRRAERSDRRTSGGLDLEVSDSYTGTARPVSTLSGGESFLASLSLALGLSDVVQAYAGGIHLDTIFVDEGFGSLDPEALDLAFRALVDLQRDGRLVGIISHVPDLRERVDTRLEVTAHRHGSKAEFAV